MSPRAFITGLAGPALAPGERAFVREAQPWGLILFERNIASPEQVRCLIDDFRDAVGRSAPVLVDQEGGRVARLKPPHWTSYPAAEVFGQLYDLNPDAAVAAAQLAARLMAAELRDLGITVNCLPVADVPVADAHAVIGSRAYGTTPEKVAALARGVARGLYAGGVIPVIKHIPGHGRAGADSHLSLPEVSTDCATLEATDFAAFRALAELPVAMTAHVVFTAFDPVAPATISATIVAEVIRRRIGFGGLLMTDDIGMGALSGTVRARAAAALAAGCDVILHCSGELEEMQMVAAEAPQLAAASLERAARAQAWPGPPQPLDVRAAQARLLELVSAINHQRQGARADG